MAMNYTKYSILSAATMIIIMLFSFSLAVASGPGNGEKSLQKENVETIPNSLLALQDDADHLDYLKKGLEDAELVKTIIVDEFKKIHLIYVPSEEHYIIMRIQRNEVGELVFAKSTVIGKNYLVNLDFLYSEEEQKHL